MSARFKQQVLLPIGLAVLRQIGLSRSGEYRFQQLRRARWAETGKIGLALGIEGDAARRFCAALQATILQVELPGAAAR
jgi:hypothetical protein